MLLLIPGCLLVQPLDEAKPDADDDSAAAPNAGSGNTSGKTSHAGNSSSAGRNTGGSGSPAGGSANGGSRNNAGSGPTPPGGSANGGSSSGVDFSLFTGDWTLTSGKNTTTCDAGTPMTEDAEAGIVDMVALGTSTDLIFAPDSECQILADVDDRTASLSQDTQPCSYTTANVDYYATYDSFEFVVSSNGQTAKATIDRSVLATDVNDNLHYCEVTQDLNYKR